MEEKKYTFCAECGERIFRLAYVINDMTYCNRCVKEKFGVEIKEREG